MPRCLPHRPARQLWYDRLHILIVQTKHDRSVKRNAVCEFNEALLDLLNTASEMIEMIGVDPSKLVGLLNDLEAEGLIVRRRDPDDRRRHIVEVSKKGRTRLAAAEPREIRGRARPPRREPCRYAGRGRGEDRLRAPTLRSRSLPHSAQRRHAASREGPSRDRAVRDEGRADRSPRGGATHGGDPDARGLEAPTTRRRSRSPRDPNRLSSDRSRGAGSCRR